MQKQRNKIKLKEDGKKKNSHHAGQPLTFKYGILVTNYYLVEKKIQIFWF